MWGFGMRGQLLLQLFPWFNLHYDHRYDDYQRYHLVSYQQQQRNSIPKIIASGLMIRSGTRCNSDGASTIRYYGPSLGIRLLQLLVARQGKSVLGYFGGSVVGAWY